MNATIIPIESEAQWLQERAKDVTSTQVSALFDCCPYLTHFELWHQKRSGIVEEFVADNRTTWGNRLEQVIAEGFAAEHGMEKPKRWNVYARREGMRLGASFDYIADSGSRIPEGGDVWEWRKVLLECKNVDYLEWREKWTETEAPPHIELQVQTQLMLSGIGRAFIVALVGGNTLVAHERTPEPEVQAKIIEKVSAFWSSVEAGIAPQPDYVRDADLLLSRICNRTDGREIEADATVAELIDQWLGAKAMADNVRPLQARIAELIGTASKVRTPHGVLSCAANKAGARPFRYYPNKEIAK